MKEDPALREEIERLMAQPDMRAWFTTGNVSGKVTGLRGRNAKGKMASRVKTKDVEKGGTVTGIEIDNTKA